MSGEAKNLDFLRRGLWCTNFLILNLEISTFIQSKFGFLTLLPLKVIAVKVSLRAVIWQKQITEFE